ncbi:hypothetical protein [Aliikangiella sp. IMCC44632]
MDVPLFVLGCIDLTKNNDSFHSWLGTQEQAIRLTVDYPNHYNYDNGL